MKNEIYLKFPKFMSSDIQQKLQNIIEITIDHLDTLRDSQDNFSAEQLETAYEICKNYYDSLDGFLQGTGQQKTEQNKKGKNTKGKATNTSKKKSRNEDNSDQDNSDKIPKKKKSKEAKKSTAKSSNPSDNQKKGKKCRDDKEIFLDDNEESD